MKATKPMNLSIWLAALVAGLSLVSCAPPMLSKFIGGSGDAAANDQIMLVRREPPSFGYRRLVRQERQYPDLDYFVSTNGLPDFLAETVNSERHYLILYYLEKRKAFACRSKSAHGHEVEFAGPYPVTEREFKVLDAFRKDPTKVPTT